ncbi:uncharacterized protein MEPE_05582 [Melanopsichium pennsylvanicum]|uniref:Uncharacterized protein n=2 Tax=Melanopsichium pennsylvanicum TaxID=63383 RepID=A0AAJ4XTI6_9BASI|nr:putative protein [Melanopsichium pennsylvanicum 4]SNX86873.1 uncharacterized protein MEPE_05582 [Melanopsichium pennsylvanicum]
MVATLLTRPTLLRGIAVSSPRATNVGLASSSSFTATLLVARSIHTQPKTSLPCRFLPLKTFGGGLVAAGSGFYYFNSTPDSASSTRSFSVYSPNESEKQVTGSSTLIRPASPAAPRRQTVNLVFLTSNSTGKGLVKSLVSNLTSTGSGDAEKWYPWMGYFREAGYDCLSMNLALPLNAQANVDEKSYEGAERTTSLLADELHTQIRLSNLQRQPVLFVHHSADSDPASTSQIVSSYIEPAKSSSGGGSGAGFLSKLFGGGGMFGSRPAISGLVVISDLDDASALTLFGKHPKLNTLIVANGGANTKSHQGKITILDAEGRSSEKIVKDVERWLIKEGYEG